MTKPAFKPPPDDRPSWQQEPSTYIVGRAHLDGADALAHELERKWGVGRLRLLVDANLRARFDSQRLKLYQAKWHGELEDVRREATRMRNAWQALDAAATAQGHSVGFSVAWEVALADGRVACIVRTTEDAWFETYRQALDSEGRAVAVYTLDEIASLIDALPHAIKAKEVFPGATVHRYPPITDPLDAMNDDLPF